MESKQENDIHLVYKKLGETPLGCIERFRKENEGFALAKVTYAGRLDPMAEGLLILLTNEKVNEKEVFLDLPKTYIVEMLWGVETDTLDVLGLVTKSQDKTIELTEVLKYLEKSTGKFEQEYPAYSSKPVQGKPLFQWAREGRINEIDIPKHEVELQNVKHLGRKNIKKENLVKEINFKVSLVDGDFRQKEILQKWNEVLEKSPAGEFVLDTLEAKVSSGFYVRQFVTDIAKNFGTVATTFHIKRQKIGDYTILNQI